MSSTESKIYRDSIDRGLEGVVACSTQISSIVGNTLEYRGYKIEDLAEHSTFEETLFLLWMGKLPTKAELANFGLELRKASLLSDSEKRWLENVFASFPKSGHPMDFLRTAVSGMAFFDPDVTDASQEALLRKSTRLTGKMGSIVSAFARLRSGKKIGNYNPEKSLAWNFLNQLLDKEPSKDYEKIFDTTLVLHVDHEINCSTFSARVTASSLSDLHSAIVSAIGTLKGPLHGGANERVMRMLSEIGSIDKARAYVEEALAGKKKVMGIGHRVYKNGDPRARILKTMSKKLTAEFGKPELFSMSELIDDTMQKKKGLMPNVDFYSATVYHCLSIPHELFTPIFAASRIGGWCAHVIEQSKNNRIYRPRGEYTGPKDLNWPGAT